MQTWSDLHRLLLSAVLKMRYERPSILDDSDIWQMHTKQPGNKKVGPATGVFECHSHRHKTYSRQCREVVSNQVNLRDVCAHKHINLRTVGCYVYCTLYEQL